MSFSQPTRKIPIPDWNQYHPWPSPAGLRYRVFFAKENGFEQCVVRVGKRVLIDEAAFFRWMEEKNAQQKTRCLKKRGRV